MKRLPKLKNNLKNYIFLMRLHKPVPILLMLWPVLTALGLAQNGLPSFKIIIIFILGVILMRSAGDVLNDLADRKWDGKIERTAMRPLAMGEISVFKACLLAGLLLLFSFSLLFFLNRFCFYLSWIAVILAIIYPLMKRFFALPQLVLGLAYNWGVIMAFAAVQNHIPISAWIFYLAMVSLTIAYDTFYAMADLKDDETVGIKSSARLFKNNVHFWVGLFQIVSLVLLSSLYFLDLNLKLYLNIIYLFSIILFIPFFIFQHYWVYKNRSISNCIRAFNNSHWPLMILCGIVFYALI